MTPPPTPIGRLAQRIIRFFREQAARETQAHLNRQGPARHRPWGIMRPAHLGPPGWSAAPCAGTEDPLEALWRLPARRPRRAI